MTGAPPKEGQPNVELNVDYLMSTMVKHSGLGAGWFDLQALREFDVEPLCRNNSA